MVKKIIFFITLLFAPLFVFGENNEEHNKRSVEQVEKTESSEPTKNIGHREEDDDILFDDDDIIGEIFNIPATRIAQDPDAGIGYWKSIKLFCSLPRETKKRLLKEHVKRHKTAYIFTGTGISLATLILSILLIRHFRRSVDE